MVDVTAHARAGQRGSGWRRFLAVYLVLFLVGTEAFLISPLLPTIARDVGVSETAAANVVTAYVLVYAITGPFLGGVSDRFGRRRSILTGTALFLVGNAVAGIGTSLTVLIVARAAAGLGAAMAGPSIWAHLAESSTTEARGRAIGVGFAFFSCGQVLGLPVGTFIAGALGWHATFLAIGAVTLVTLLGLHLQVRPTAKPVVGSAGAALRAVFSVWRNGIIGHALAVTLLLQAANLGAYSFLGALLEERFGLTVNQRGFVGLLVGGGSVLGSLLAGRLGDRARRRGRSGVALIGLWCLLLGVGIVLAVQGSALWLALAAIGLWFLASGAFGTDQQTLIATAAPEQRATSVSWNNSIMYVGAAAGVLLVGGFPGQQAGMTVAAVVLTVPAALVAAALSMRAARGSRRPDAVAA
ncbi:MFS transporter [Kutzneria sp. 744]|uniref:MFS transporter n=1 Tax=Kutzneria sp. (strain 744) TaxID=345341 RepID=UPI0003EEB71A|nr:MFS transporter [Kutzneria sp. 744]EWM13603.1 multidrug resistance protein [Kutzneria sp. 744]